MPHVNRIICLDKKIILALLFFTFEPVSEVIYCSVDDDQDLAVVTVNLNVTVTVTVTVNLWSWAP